MSIPFDLTEPDGESTDLHLEQSFLTNDTSNGCGSTSSRQYGALAGQSLYDVVTENLNEQIRELQDINMRLLNTIHEKNFEISRLSKQSPSASDSLDKDSFGSKITELAKAKRELTAKYEAEHSRHLKLQAENSELRARLEQCEEKVTAVFHDREIEDQQKRKFSSRLSDKKLTPEDTDVASLHHRLQAAIEKVSVATQENQCLKQQLQRSVKLLERELGPNINIAEMLKDPNATYRGRDQQIQILRSKLETAKKQLESFDLLFEQQKSELKSVLVKSDPAKMVDCMGDQNSYNARHRERLSYDDQKRRADFLALTDEHNGLLQNHSELRSKLTAAKARIDYLSKENSRLSQFNRHVVETCQKDAEIIRYFQTTIAELRNAFSQSSLPVSLPDTNSHPQTEAQSQSSSKRLQKSRCSTERSIFRKISNMENEINDLKHVHSLTFEQLDRVGTDGVADAFARNVSAASEYKSSSQNCLLSKRSSTSSSAANSHRRTPKPDLRESNDSLDDCQGKTHCTETTESISGSIAGDRREEAENCETVVTELQAPAQLKTLFTVQCSKEDSCTSKECSRIQPQVQHSRLQKSSLNPSPLCQKKVTNKSATFGAAGCARMRPAFSCYTR